jgi:hypothetical protein
VREIQAAALAAAKAAWNVTPTQTYEIGDVAPSPATPYNVVGVTSPAARNKRGDGTTGSKGYSITVQSVGRTASEVAFAVEKGEAAFLDKRLTVSGFDVSAPDPDEVVSSPVIRDPDAGGLLVCTVVYPITAYPV